MSHYHQYMQNEEWKRKSLRGDDKMRKAHTKSIRSLARNQTIGTCTVHTCTHLQNGTMHREILNVLKKMNDIHDNESVDKKQRIVYKWSFSEEMLLKLWIEFYAHHFSQQPMARMQINLRRIKKRNK